MTSGISSRRAVEYGLPASFSRLLPITGHASMLTIVPRLDGGKNLCILLYKIGQLEQKPTPVFPFNVGPDSLKGLTSSVYGIFDIVDTGCVYTGDLFLGSTGWSAVVSRRIADFHTRGRLSGTSHRTWTRRTRC